MIWWSLGNPKCVYKKCRTPNSRKCTPDDFFVEIWWGTRKKMCLSFLSNGSEGNIRILPGWDKSTKNPLRSHVLTLDECALDAKHCVTVVEEWWKTWVIFPVTRVCLSTSKSTNWCLPLGIHWTVSPEMRLSSMTSRNLHNDELGCWPFLYSFPKP